jgi:hypothetical protein
MNSDVLQRVNQQNKQNGNNETGEAGRPTNESQGKEVTEKTIQNRESQS